MLDREHTGARDIVYDVELNIAQVLADQQRVIQVLRSLIENALKFSPANRPVTIRVCVRKRVLSAFRSPMRELAFRLKIMSVSLKRSSRLNEKSKLEVQVWD